MNELMIPLSTASISATPKNHRILPRINPGVIVPDRRCRNTGIIARINNDRKPIPRIIFIMNRLNPGCRYFRKYARMEILFVTRDSTNTNSMMLDNRVNRSIMKMIKARPIRIYVWY